MKLHINDDWRITSTETCWQVERYAGTYKSGNSVGKPKWVAKSYHANLPQAIESLAQRLLRMSEASTFREALDAAKRIAEEITTALQSAGLLLSFDIKEVSK